MPNRRQVPKSTIIAVRVKPGASRAHVGGRYDGPHGAALILAVRERAVDGRATEAARRALAEALDLPRGSVRLHSGPATRDKLFAVDDPPSDLGGRLARLLEAGP